MYRLSAESDCVRRKKRVARTSHVQLALHLLVRRLPSTHAPATSRATGRTSTPMYAETEPYDADTLVLLPQPSHVPAYRRPSSGPQLPPPRLTAVPKAHPTAP